MARPRIETPEAVEGSTYPVTVSFTDENGDAVVPNAGLAWKLTDQSGTVINSRSAVAVSPAASVTIVLSGADLAVPAGAGVVRRLLAVSGTYNSDLGSNLAIQEEVEFQVRELRAL